MPQKILLDTDIGSDIDDAVCLAYLLAQPEAELLGITTVSGEPLKRAMLASALCKVAGVEIPIYPGTGPPLLVQQQQPEAPQAAALSRWDYETDFPQGEAVEFLRQTIRQHPGEITLLTIGPLTNIALLFKADPEIPALLKQLVMMIGVFVSRTGRGNAREWNALLDPHAAAIVYQSEVAVHRSIGLDVTGQVTMPADEVRQKFQTQLLQPVLDFAEVWFQQREVITFHDPLAAATLFDDQICTFERGRAEVEVVSQPLGGFTAWQADSGLGPHEIALGVDADRFFTHYFSVFSS